MKFLKHLYQQIQAAGIAACLVCAVLFGPAYTPITLVQQLRQEVAKAKSFYDASPTLYMHSIVYGVPVGQPGQKRKLGTAEMYRDKYNFYSNAFGREMYCSGKRAVTIDHAKKTLTLYQGFDVKRMMQEQELPVDSMLKHITAKDSIVLLKQQNNQLGYRLYVNRNKNVFTDLVFDAREHYLKNYNYSVYSGEEDLQSEYALIKVHYDQVSKKLPRRIDFDPGRFLSGTGKNMVVNQKLLKGYRLKVKRYTYEAGY